MIKTFKKDTYEMLEKVTEKELGIQSEQYNETLYVAENTPVCQALKNARLQTGQDFTEISAALRISQNYLQAVEDANLNVLPERVYTLGFVRSYARYLGFDPEDIVQRFKSEVLGDIPVANYSMPKPVDEDALPKKSILYITTTIVILCLLGLWYYFNKNFEPLDRKNDIPAVIQEELKENSDSNLTPSENITTQLPAADQAETVSGMSSKPVDQVSISSSATPSQSVAAEGKANISSAGDHRFSENSVQPSISASQGLNTVNSLVTTPNPQVQVSGASENKISLNFIEPSWVELRDEKGTVVLNHTFKNGDHYSLEIKPGMSFSTGNAGGIQVMTDSNQSFFLGKKGEVMKNLPLNADLFKHP